MTFFPRKYNLIRLSLMLGRVSENKKISYVAVFLEEICVVLWCVLNLESSCYHAQQVVLALELSWNKKKEW